MYKELIDAYLEGKENEMLEDLKALICIDSQSLVRCRESRSGKALHGRWRWGRS